MRTQEEVRMTIRGGYDAVVTKASSRGFNIELGYEGIDTTVRLDYGEARELMQAIFEAIYEYDFVPSANLYGGRHEEGVRCTVCGSKTASVRFGTDEDGYAVGCNECLED